MSAARRTVIAIISVFVVGSWSLAAAACGPWSSGEGGSADTQRIAQVARGQFGDAAAAILHGDQQAFLGALPVGGALSGAAREAMTALYAALSPLPWRTFAFELQPVDENGTYRLQGSGQLGEAGPPDRIAVIRYLKLDGAAKRVKIVADVTPERFRRRYLMALHDPVALQRRGLIVLADRWARERAARVLAAAARSRPRLARLGISAKSAVVITVYGSVEDIRDALGVDAPAARVRFFAHPALRVTKTDWPTYDVGVLGPWLRDLDLGIDDVLTHELAHAYTVCWFAQGKRAPSVLVEGIAEAAEGTSAGSAVREEVAAGDQLWPLPDSFAVTDVWDGGDAEDVELGYQLGASLVEYVVRTWGAGKLRPFAEAVAGADATEAGMDEALADVLGVTWRQFFSGWRRYVLAGG